MAYLHKLKYYYCHSILIGHFSIFIYVKLFFFDAVFKVSLMKKNLIYRMPILCPFTYVVVDKKVL